MFISALQLLCICCKSIIKRCIRHLNCPVASLEELVTRCTSKLRCFVVFFLFFFNINVSAIFVLIVHLFRDPLSSFFFVGGVFVSVCVCWRGEWTFPLCRIVNLDRHCLKSAPHFDEFAWEGRAASQCLMQVKLGTLAPSPERYSNA